MVITIVVTNIILPIVVTIGTERGKIMSEVARLLQQIEMEYVAAKRGLEAYAIVSKHEFITARYDQAGIYQDQ
jgi:hypothetical protein